MESRWCLLARSFSLFCRKGSTLFFTHLLMYIIFQTLRDLIPQNDQKRDRASFMLEVLYNISTFCKRNYRYMREPTKDGVQNPRSCCHGYDLCYT
ncbi:hypothetical protein MTR67_012407 [Solanum verrucosum]|uniref:Uncharacterized protein n=1 Tax=Solanum verrucosum TaxID=315347 RepID=A0AAF0Q9R7_SOLVR|nr:hypothetical protein MTR67_012407 [Solanum verrucosum]